ncbi:MAG TPA: hypothetical protein VJ770_06855 [Stellaceae bacterium]|nr:hypothetical protein [Stellaceae bacterium]
MFCAICPQKSSDWLYYRYFPEAEVIDLRDFWPPEAMAAALEEAGFAAVSVAFEPIRFAQDLSAWLEIVRRRDTCSELLAISDAAY